jgi:hypothetical protein
MRRTFLADNADEPLIVFDIPLLFEKTGNHGLDAVMVVSAPAERQRAGAGPAGHDRGKVRTDPEASGPDAEKRAGRLRHRYRGRWPKRAMRCSALSTRSPEANKGGDILWPPCNPFCNGRYRG